MHPAFVSRRRRAPIPIWFVTTETWRAACATQLDAAARALRRSRRVRAEGRASRCCCPARTARWPACCSASSRPTSPTRTASCPAACPACCRPAPIASPTRRMTRGSPRSPSRSAPTVHALPQGRARTACGSSCPTASTATTSRASPRASTLARDLINTPANDMGPAELEDAARALAARHGATIQRHRRRRSAEAELPADPRGRPRLRRARRG